MEPVDSSEIFCSEKKTKEALTVGPPTETFVLQGDIDFGCQAAFSGFKLPAVDVGRFFSE